jgi:malate dehydrogenase
MRNKITIVGAGNVGASCAAWLAERDPGEIVLVDIPQTEGMPKGKALDITQAGPVLGFDTRVIGTTSYDETAGSDVVVITAGVPRKPGMTREDLVGVNQTIVSGIVNNVTSTSPNAILIVVTNPLDTMVYLACKKAGLPRNRVMGQAGILDSARMATFIAMELNVSVQSVQASVMGGHGDEMVPLVRYSTVAGIPITQLMSTERVAAIVDRTRKGGGEIVSLLKTGSAYYAPGAAAGQMVEAILKDKKLVVPASAYLDGEYGLKDICFGVPVKLGREGIEQIMQVELNDEERSMLDKSVELIRGTMEALKL